jgi:protoporphyrinogen oxidase/ubiquinone/menaquinone biosynthesis C-methylase UbiE
MKRIGIIGGGPGGLFTARLLNEKLGRDAQVSIFEASGRLGGKIRTATIGGALYEAGAAELYDYSHYGPDPLKRLIQTLGLKTVPMAGTGVILGDTVIQDVGDIAPLLGAKTAQTVAEFYAACEALCSPAAYYDDHYQDDNSHAWAGLSLRQVLDAIADDAARHYVETAIHSDVATEPHLTNALNGLKNILMEDPRYMGVYSIAGGIEQLVTSLRRELTATVHLNARVVEVRRDGAGYALGVAGDGAMAWHHFDGVICALPDYWLSQIVWPDADLRRSLQKHIAHYDRPAHYLRITALFERPFWRSFVQGSYFMQDALGGCCLYDESARYPTADGKAALSWLVAGSAALSFSNLDDAALIQLALQSLPPSMAAGAKLFVEGRVHRWVGAINGLPGGHPVQETALRHQPSGRDPNLFLVGDYLFDSTLNGVYDSADFVAHTVLTQLRREEYFARPDVGGPDQTAVPNDYFTEYADDTDYNQSFDEYFCENWTCDLIEAVWGAKPPYKLLDCGSANGLTLERFESKNVEAWGIENSRYIHSQTAAKWLDRNLLGDVCKLPFPDNSFDFVYETCLCYLPPDKIDQAIQELFRVCRIGVICGSISTDMTKELTEEEDLLYGVRTFATMLEWAEFYQRGGFRVAIGDPGVLDRVWQIEQDANEGYPTWYPDAETMRYCFFSKPDVAPRVIAPPRAKRSASVVAAPVTVSAAIS